MSFSRRSFLRSLCRTALVLSLEDVLALAIPPARPAAQSASPQAGTAAGAPSVVAGPLGVSFIDVAKQSGLNAKTIYGGENKNKYLLETTGCGVAFYDYDQDGWLDIFLVNGTRLEGYPKGEEPICHLFKNNRDGTFTDVTLKAGVARSGWGQGCCVGDYDNDGHDDLFVSYYGQNVLWRNKGDGTFEDVTARAGLLQKRLRWNSGCAFLDYNRDGHLDLFVANYIDLDLKTAPVPESGPCLYKGVMVACGPPGLPGGKNILYRNNGDGTFTDVSEQAGILNTTGTYGLGVLVADFDDDGWPDIYVANDSVQAVLYQNKRNGTFEDVAVVAGAALSPDGKPQAGMGVTAGDYNRDGRLDIFKTNFAGDTHSLYKNDGGMSFEDETFSAGLGVNTKYLGWGCGFFDMDNDGWLDILVCNGHVYPEVNQLKSEAAYNEHKFLYRNLRNGRFEDVSARGGPGLMAEVAARGCAFGDFDNDGDVDVVVNCVNAPPQLLRCDSKTGHHWIKVKTLGTRSNRTGVGARIRCLARIGGTADEKPVELVDEVRSGGSYYSQNDLRVHFGLGKATRVESLEVRWPSGLRETFAVEGVDRVVTVKEGAGKAVAG